ncbi:hypothetical protein F5Y03DRAFT_242779 [Xylaria venustula]|nr:hypothetical protein F5Y03DRAFT_242779 [Xylaria venustula]
MPGTQENTQTLSFFQHNTRKVNTVHQTVLQQAFEQNTHIILLQEPYLVRIKNKDKRVTYTAINHPEYFTVLPQPGNPSVIETKPRVMAYIRKSIEFTPLYDKVDNPDVQLIKVFGAKTFQILHVYNERQEKGGQYTEKRVLQNLSVDSLPTLIAENFNRHNPW